MQSAIVHPGVTLGAWLLHPAILALTGLVGVAFTASTMAVFVQHPPLKQIVGDIVTGQWQMPTPRTRVGLRILHIETLAVHDFQMCLEVWL
jgi:hypothetical protein